MADYIDREALVKDMRKRFCDDCDKRKGTKNGKMRFVYDIGDAPCRACWVDDAIDEVECYPSADVRENVLGYWDIHRGNWADEFECSVCHKISKTGGNYCSNCGADMREVQDAK